MTAVQMTARHPRHFPRPLALDPLRKLLKAQSESHMVAQIKIARRRHQQSGAYLPSALLLG